MKKKILGFVTIVSGLLAASASFAATDWSTQDYDLYPGDFDGDGKTDVLYVARDASKASGIARSDGSGPNIPFQSWPSNYLGIPWYGNVYSILVADFNDDNKDDLFLQRTTPGDSFLLLTDANGKVTSISQQVSNSALGLTWSGDQHKIQAGDFDGDGRADLFLQARSAAGTNAVVVADTNGQFTAGPLQTWTDGSWSAFKWSTVNSNLFVGYFNDDGKADLLVQAKPKIVLIDYDIPIPVPTYPPNANGVVLSQEGTPPFVQAGVQQWSRTANGVDWSPLVTNIIVGDFDGNGRADVILQARNASRPSYLLSGNAAGSVFGAGTALATNVTWAADSYRLIAGNFDGTGGAGVYYQAVLSTGTNSYANTVTGGSVSTTTHNPSAPMGVLPTTAVGNTAGSFAVSDGGTATYSIPIDVPPGIADMQPNLALTYSSGLGSGSVGIGWRLSGLSEISRCNKTLEQDSSNDAVLLSASDRFCLDGNKLRLTSGASYGANGSTYQTELETFARVTANVPGSSGPAWFKVESKDGLTYEYGNSGDSRIESLNPSASTTVRTWALNKVTDRAGNFMTITYQEDGSTNGSFRPTTITYTENPNSTPSPTPAAYKVRFYWDSRPTTDKLLRYVGGGVVRETFRLNRIESEYNHPTNGWSLVRKYQLSYNTSGVSQRSRLAAVQECDGSAKCLAPTTIAWQEGTFGWSATTSGSTTLPASATHGMPIDMNGDGRTDYAFFDTGTNFWRVMFANDSGGYDTPVNAYAGSASTYEWAIPIDANGDGRRDLLVANPSDGKWWWVRHTTGTAFASSATTLSYTIGSFPADVNGDGLDDIVSASSNVLVAFNQSNGITVSLAAPALAWTVPANSVYWSFGGAGDFSTSDIYAADFNGDGRDDVLVETREDTTGGEPGVPPHYLYAWHVLQSTGSTFTEIGTILSSTFAMPRPLFTDINSDGLVDLVYKKMNTSTLVTTWRYRLSTGGIGSEVDTGVTAYLGTGAIADCDGDGYPDLVGGAATSGNFICIKSDGAALATTAIDLGAAGGAKVADVSGDGLADFVGLDGSNVMKIRPHRGVMPDFVSNIADGFGNTVAVTYAPLTDLSFYTKGTTASFPNIDVQAPLYAVKKYGASDGIGGSYEMSYSYAGARVNVQGRGLLGFATRAWIDSRTQIRNSLTYKQAFPHIGFVEEASAYQPNAGPLITQILNTPGVMVTGTATNQGRSLPYVSQSIHKSYEVGGAGNSLAIAEVTQNTTLSSYGDPTVVQTVTADKTGSGLFYTTTTTNTYATADTTNWCVSFIERQRVESTVPVYGTETRIVDYTKDAANPTKCRASHEIIEPTDATGLLKVTTAFQFDVFGHVSSQTVSAVDVAPRTTMIAFGTQGVFPMTITNAELKSTVNTFDFALGVLLTTIDPNALSVSLEYDGFGRLTMATRPDGTKTVLTYSACTAVNGYCGDSRLRYKVETQELDNSTPGGVLIRSSRQLFDAYGRSLYDQSQAFSGAYATIATNYDNEGRLRQRSQPYFPGDAAYFTTVSYDMIGRVTQEQRQISKTDTSSQSNVYGYNRLTHTQTDAENKATTRIFDAIGQIVQVTDANGGITKYEYDSFGNLKKTIDPLLNEIRNTFNLRGFKTSTRDADMKTFNYAFFPTGELRTQTDAKSQVATFTYDVMSRPTTRVEAEGTTTFTYGGSQSLHNIGKLVSTSHTPPSSGVVDQSRSFAFDNKGRLQDDTTLIEGTSHVVSSTYSTTTGLLETTTYPTSTSAVAGSRFKVKYEYANGLLHRTRDFNAPSTIYWERVATDAAGQTTDEQYGNGLHTNSEYDAVTGLLATRMAGATSQVQKLAYRWNKVGSLTQREDRRITGAFLTEDFYYDNLHRLYQSKLNTATNLDVGYNALGNISSKTAVGTYAYPSSGTNSVRPHAVTAAGANSYTYDDNGNISNHAGGGVSWYSYDKPNLIDKGGNSSQFFYGVDRARYKQIAVNAAGGSLPAGTETTIYVAGGLFEKVTKSSSGVVEYKHHIMAGSEAVAIRTLRAGTSSVNDTRYLHKDHLGSLDVITDESGGVIARLSYDAFGNRRSGTTWSGAPSSGEWSAIAAVTHRGFTFHEHLDNVEAIHMNGRVFDPKLARFLSADPFVQAPWFSQSFNRYSYTFNNPLSYVDPSGYAGQPPGPDDDNNTRLPIYPPGNFLSPGWNPGPYYSGIRAWGARLLAKHFQRQLHPSERVNGYSGSTVSGSWSAWSLLGVSSASAADAQGLFDRLWSGYPSNKPYVDAKTGRPPPGYEDQCAIQLSVAFHNAGIDMKSFNGAGVIRLNGYRTAIRAQEFATWLKGSSIPGVGRPEVITGSDWADRIDGRTGVIFFGDYWVRPGGQRTGDHIDLWNGSRMTPWTSWIRVQTGLHWDGYWSDYSRSRTIIFWPVE